MQNVMLESLSSGVPAICPDAPGYSSIVDSKKGFLVERVYSEYVKKIIYLEKNRNILKDILIPFLKISKNKHTIQFSVFNVHLSGCILIQMLVFTLLNKLISSFVDLTIGCVSIFC